MYLSVFQLKSVCFFSFSSVAYSLIEWLKLFDKAVSLIKAKLCFGKRMFLQKENW